MRYAMRDTCFFMKNSFKIYTLGCKVNQYDSLDLRKKLEKAGLKFAAKKADWAIINTCAVTKTAIRKDRQMISKAKNENPCAKIVLFGCFSKVYKKEADKLKVDRIFGVRENNKIVKLITNYKILNTQDKIKNFPEKVRYFLKIQDGCEQFCTYCIIPYTRGKLQSRGEGEVLKEAEEVVRRGVKEVVLTGIHLGLYGQEEAGSNKRGKRRLVNLIEKLFAIKKLKRIRLSSIEISEVTDELIKLIKNNKKLSKHLHIPLQSGSDKILKSMNRPYNKKYFQERLDKIRKNIPGIAISIDVIVGFPGEGVEEFKETYEFIKKNKFSKLHVFPFSEHELTPASKLPNKLKQNNIIERAAEIRKLGERLEEDYKKNFKNKNLEVLVENKKNGICAGKSEYYFDVKFKDDDYKIGEMVEIKFPQI